MQLDFQVAAIVADSVGPSPSPDRVFLISSTTSHTPKVFKSLDSESGF